MRHFKIMIGIVAMVLLFSCDSGTNKIPVDKLFPVSLESNGELMYINTEGKIVINPQFEEASLFTNGLALVRLSGDDKYGFINEEGNFVIQPIYKEATEFREGLAWVVEKGKAPACIDKEGYVMFTLTQAEQVHQFSEGLAAFSIDTDEDELWGFVNKKGEVQIEPQFYDPIFFREGLCPVMNEDEKYGFIEKEGQLVINYLFEKAYPFNQKHAIVSDSEKNGVIGSDGIYTINPIYERLYNDLDLISFRNNEGKIGWMRHNGDIAIKPQFDESLLFGSAELAPVALGDKWGYINRDGKFEINPQFKHATPFFGSIAFYSNDEYLFNRYGLVDIEGKVIVEPQFYFDLGVMFSRLYYYIGMDIDEYYSHVKSDYFNIDTIVNSIDINNHPKKLSLIMTFNEIKEKFNLKESDFSKESHRAKYITSTNVSKDAMINFGVAGSAFNAKQVTKSNGWWSYTDTEYYFNGEGKPSRFVYEIDLYNRGKGKSEMLTKAFVEKYGDPVSSYKDGEYEEFFFYDNIDLTIIKRRNSVELHVGEAPL
ncbi:MAG: WG repeat-containing protein [Prolixibacteraceae bacterium]|jgi:hypothetical protein|nr:WG repeat-containing protein [Prolixibacteraceae bacterium]